jgi:hypothetical protein
VVSSGISNSFNSSEISESEFNKWSHSENMFISAKSELVLLLL